MRYKINYLKIFLFIIFFSFNYIKNLNAEISNNIVVMVGDEMITSYDLEQEKTIFKFNKSNKYKFIK